MLASHLLRSARDNDLGGGRADLPVESLGHIIVLDK